MDICIFGASSDKIDASYGEAVTKLGEIFGEAGHTLIYGGGRGGLMGKCAHACFAHGGKVIGIAPGFFDIPGVLLKTCGEFILTETMNERKDIMEAKADAFVLLPGGIGSFDEFFEVLTLKQLGKIEKPLVILNTNGYYDKMFLFLEQVAQEKFMSDDCLELYKVCTSPEEVLEKINEKEVHEGYHKRIADYNR